MSNAKPVLPRIAAGDTSAVDECLQRYGGLVWSLARRRCADVQLAEDAVQNIFLHLWKVAATFDESIASETTFIAMVARRRLIDYQRKQMSKKDFVQCEFDHLEMESVDPSAKIEISEEAARAVKILSQLPADQQTVIRLSVFEGLSHSRIAEQTGLKLGTVKTHIRRGITKIRESLFKENMAEDKTSNAKNPNTSSPKGSALFSGSTTLEKKANSRSNKHHTSSATGKFGGLSSN